MATSRSPAITDVSGAALRLSSIAIGIRVLLGMCAADAAFTHAHAGRRTVALRYELFDEFFAFQDTGVDWELWLPAEGDLLPKRLKILQKGRTGQPVIDLTFKAWDFAPQITEATFVPKMPAEYEGIAIVQRAAAVKNARK